MNIIGIERAREMLSRAGHTLRSNGWILLGDNCLEALAALDAEKGAEAVAWEIRVDGKWKGCLRHKGLVDLITKGRDVEITPLYASPPQAMPPWVSCEIRLPEIGKTALMFCNSYAARYGATNALNANQFQIVTIREPNSYDDWSDIYWLEGYDASPPQAAPSVPIKRLHALCGEWRLLGSQLSGCGAMLSAGKLKQCADEVEAVIAAAPSFLISKVDHDMAWAKACEIAEIKADLSFPNRHEYRWQLEYNLRLWKEYRALITPPPK